jgi:hypothetical protein
MIYTCWSCGFTWWVDEASVHRYGVPAHVCPCTSIMEPETKKTVDIDKVAEAGE